MGITLSDIRRAVLGGGDVSAFVPALRQALDNPPGPSIASLDPPVDLPEEAALLGNADNDLTSLLKKSVEGHKYDGSPIRDVDLSIAGLPPYGRNISNYFERVVDEIEPDIVAIDTSPLRLSTEMLYAFGMPCALGLPMYGEIMAGDGGQSYGVETFYPGSMNQTAVVKCWLSKIPLIPVGMPLSPGPSRGLTVGEDYLNKEMRKANLVTAYYALDEGLEKVSNLEQGIEMTDRICSSMSNTIGGNITEKLIEEIKYISSRIVETAFLMSRLGRKAKLLAVVDFEFYVILQELIDALIKGITDEIFLPARRDSPAASMAMISRHSVELIDYAQERIPETTSVQELFRCKLEILSETNMNEQPVEDEVDALITAIAARTRDHPDIVHGASVRGTIAFKEVAQGFKEIKGGLTRDSIEKAALITLPPRISTRQGVQESAAAIVGDIVKEVLYRIRFSKPEPEIVLPDKMDLLSTEDIMEGLQDFDPAQFSQEQKQNPAQEMKVAIVPEGGGRHDLSEYLKSEGLSKKQQSSVKEAIEHFLEELERKLRRGEITEDEYNREKKRFEKMLNAASGPRYRMSGTELSETLMEFMDAQDKQWEKAIKFKQMYTYYHAKPIGERKALSSPKKDFHGLRAFIDDLEEQGVLRAVTPGRDFTLTAKALDTLLEDLVPKAGRGKELRGMIDRGKKQVSERNHGIRRYSLGDVFRDISVRHTLKEIARQKKNLSDVRRRDFRVFVKQRRRVQSDIVVCVDTSGSMGYRRKLAYARLAAAGLAKAALESGDRVGLVAFDDFGRTVMPLTDEKEGVFDYIATIGAGGNTNIGDGIKCAAEILLREPSRNQKYTVLITDGEPTAISEKAIEKLKPAQGRDVTEEYAILETRRAAASGVKLSVIYVTNGEEAGKGFVKKIARAGKGKVRRISSAEDLRTMMR